MMRAWVPAAAGVACAVLVSCAPVQTVGWERSAARFSVAVFGDVPYVMSEGERAAKLAAYERLLESIERAPVAFAVHIGDFAYAEQCSDSVYERRRQEFDRLAHPLVYLFGDNEWVDCRAPYDPAERLVRLRSLFAAPGTGTLGRRRFALARQPLYPENVRWQRGGVTFIGVNVVGSNNNWGRDSLPGPEWTTRNAANIAWLRESFAAARRDESAGVAVFMQANPLPSAAARSARPNGFGPLMEEFRRLALEFDRPVALVHGDTHTFRVDKPFADPTTARVFAQITRAETFGDPSSHWLVMHVDARDPAVFTFAPVVVPGNALRGR